MKVKSRPESFEAIQWSPNAEVPEEKGSEEESEEVEEIELEEEDEEEAEEEDLGPFMTKEFHDFIEGRSYAIDDHPRGPDIRIYVNTIGPILLRPTDWLVKSSYDVLQRFRDNEFHKKFQAGKK